MGLSRREVRSLHPAPPPRYCPRNERKTVNNQEGGPGLPAALAGLALAGSFSARVGDDRGHICSLPQRASPASRCGFLSEVLAGSPGLLSGMEVKGAGVGWASRGQAAQVIVPVPPISSFGQQTQSRVPAICSAHFIDRNFVLKTCRRAAICLHFCHSAVITLHLPCGALSRKPLGLEGEHGQRWCPPAFHRRSPAREPRFGPKGMVLMMVSTFCWA